MADVDVRGSNKRRRASSSLHINELPDSVLSDVASYLSKPSRVMFAVSMTASSSSWVLHQKLQLQPSASSKTILSSSSSEQWDVLDFEDIEKNLANKLTDDDVVAILLCMDSHNNLKTLKLTGCINIVGSGLQPLSGSTVIEQIDLSLVKMNESPSLKKVAQISEAAVLPILNSIVEAEHNSLKHLLLPKQWRMRQNESLRQFLEEYNDLLESRRRICLQCKSEDNFVGQWIHQDEGDNYWLQDYTCYKCTDYVCDACTANDKLGFCMNCRKDYCQSCSTMSYCERCSDHFCSGCEPLIMETCVRCNQRFCTLDCGPEQKCTCWEGPRCIRCAPRGFTCDSCNKTGCRVCAGEDWAVACEACEKTFCSGCRFSETSKHDWKDSCGQCLQIISHLIPKLARENEQVKRENEQVTKENEKVTKENEELREELQKYKQKS